MNYFNFVSEKMDLRGLWVMNHEMITFEIADLYFLKLDDIGQDKYITNLKIKIAKDMKRILFDKLTDYRIREYDGKYYIILVYKNIFDICWKELKQIVNYLNDKYDINDTCKIVFKI